MLRATAKIFAAFATTIAGLVAVPAAAQSFAIVSAPVFVASPTVEQTHRGVAIAPQPAAAQVASAPRPTAAVPHTFSTAPANLPKWQAPGRARPQHAWGTPAARPSRGFVSRRAVDYNYGVADYGPFRVIDETRVALLGETDGTSVQWFARLMRDYPGIAQLDMVECPGTLDDRANMQLGRMIRQSGIATHVPAIGSVRSGAVELFLAGVERSVENGAEFAVHSWRDEWGREADDFAPDAPQNRKYIDYYREMGMSVAQARAFYDMTNSVPHHRARWLNAGDIRPWIAAARKTNRAPKLAYQNVTFS